MRAADCARPGLKTLLRRAGRQRNLAATAAKVKTALSTEQLTARPGVVPTYAASASALIAVLLTLPAQAEVLAGQVEQGSGRHPDAGIYRSHPGLGTILGARVLAEVGDHPNRYPDARNRKNYSGMSPTTAASGIKRVVLARYARNRRLGDVLFLQAYSALQAHPERGTTSPRSNSLPSPPSPRQPPGRHPARLPQPPHALRREPSLAHPLRGTTFAADDVAGGGFLAR